MEIFLPIQMPLEINSQVAIDSDDNFQIEKAVLVSERLSAMQFHHICPIWTLLDCIG